MKKTSNHIITWMTIIIFLIEPLLWPATVFAQEISPTPTPPLASSGATPTPTPTPTPAGMPEFINPFTQEASVAGTPAPSPTPIPTTTLTPTPSITSSPTPTLEPTLDQPTPPATSARFRLALSARKLAKKYYRAAEGVVISVDNVIDQAPDIHVSVVDAGGKDTSVVIDTTTIGQTEQITVHQRSSLRPGKYKVRVYQKDTLLSEQDFLWGVLAINPNKSIYAPGETAHLSIAVLNEFGKMVCNAQVRLDVTDPDGQITTLSTTDGSIVVNHVCTLRDFTLIPDYEANYQTTVNGRYGMVLTATTNNGTYAISDSFEADDTALFDVERTSATRIFPPKTYPMTISVTAKTDFTGTVEETIPQNFTVTQQPGVLSYNEASIVADDANATTSAQTISLGQPYAGDFHVTQGFGARVTDPDLKQKYAHFGVIGHDGVDFDLPLGSDVLAVDDGVVAYVGPEPYGKTLILEHSWGRSYYGHLSQFTVVVGQTVTKGTVIAISGNTGESTGPHLHFGMRMNSYNAINGYYGKINPMPYLTATTAVVSDVAVKKIYWDLTIRKGETKTLGYTYQTPPESPQFYLMGPLRFRGSVKDLPPIDFGTETSATASADNAFVLGTTNESTSSALSTPTDTPIQTPTPDPIVPSIASPSAQQTATSSADINANIRALKRRPRERLQQSGVVFSESRQWQLAIDAIGNTLSSIQHVTGTVGTTGTQVNVSISGGTALNKMFHFCSFRGDTADAQHDQTYRNSILSSTSNLQLNVGRTPNQQLTYDCYVVIYTADSDLVVNRYTTDTTVTPRHVTITAVSALAQAFVIPHGQSIPNDQTIGVEEEFEYQLTTTTNVDLIVSGANNAAADTMAFEVVDWNNSDIRVQHDYANAMASGATSATTTLTSPVNTAKTWIICTARENGGSFSQQTGAESYRADLQDASTVRIRRGISGTTDPVVWGVEVIEDMSYYGLWNTQMGNISMGAAVNTGTLTLSPSVKTANTMVLGTAYPHFTPSGSIADTTVDNFDNTMITIVLTDQSTITATRAVNDGWAADWFVQSVEFINQGLGLDLSDLMRHGNWFSAAGVEQYFVF